jgi:hypothetical protein
MVIYTMYTGFGGPKFLGALCGCSPRTPSSTALLISHTVHCISGPLFMVTNNAGVDPLGMTFYPPTESFGNYECYQRIL